MIDPLLLTNKIEKLVTKKQGNVEYRKYYRFRKDRWYGGIITGDVIGCNLRCKFCWAWKFSWNPYAKGKYLNPHQVFSILTSLARKYGVRQLRLSGGEPTIGFKHLLELINLTTESGFHFILETNGIILGTYKELAYKLGRYHKQGIEIRVSIKGTSPEEFTRLTGAKQEYWYTQLRALRNLIEAGLEPGEEVYAAVMLSFNPDKGLTRMKRILSSIDGKLAETIDKEYIILYPHVIELLKRTKLKPKVAYKPNEIPDEMI